MKLDPLSAALHVSASGMEAQSQRLLVVSENMANAQSTSSIAGGDPYRRKTISFSSALERETGARMVEVGAIDEDPSAFPTEFDPSHQAADAAGYVKMPNVNVLIEMADMREASRSYQANLQVLKQARQLVSMTIDLLKNT